MKKFGMYLYKIFRFSIRNLAYIGLRSVDKYERLTIEKYGIPAYTMEDIQRFNYYYINGFISPI